MFLNFLGKFLFEMRHRVDVMMAVTDQNDHSGAGSDYMSYTQLGYPAGFASEGNPSAGGGRIGEYDPYVHGVGDVIDIDDETGVFSFDVRASPSRLHRTLLILIQSNPAAHGSVLRACYCFCGGAGWMGQQMEVGD